MESAKSYAATDVFGATSLPNGNSTDLVAGILAEQTNCGDSGANIVVDASGVESSIRLGIHILGSGGTFVQAGMDADDINFPIAAVCGKEITVKGSFRYGPGDYETAIRLMTLGKVKVAPLIKDIVPFSRAEEALCGMRSKKKKIKTIIRGPTFSD